jgi:ribosome maturation factor RimP
MEKGIIKEAVEKFVFDFGYVPLDVRIIKKNESYEVHFSIFKKSSVTLSDCSRVTLAVRDFLSVFLACDDLVLDISSPGAERVLKKPFEYSLFEGKLARIVFVDGLEVSCFLNGYDEIEKNVSFLDRITLEKKNVPFVAVSKCQLLLE